jgi:RND family efflux transporter MFP subunit
MARAAAIGLMSTAVTLAWSQNSPVPTATVQSSSAAGSYMLDGVIQAVKQSTVAAQASGRIVSFTVKAGDKVRAGQVLATIDDREAQVGAQRAQAQINQADADLANAKAHMDRTRDLQAQGFVSKAALDNASAQFKSAQAQREQAAASGKQSALAQGYTRVTAPLDGWVLQTFAQAGDLAMPGAPLLVVYAPQPLRAVVQVPASRTQAVRSAKQTSVLIDNGTAAQSITPLNRLKVPSSDPVSQTTEWRLDLPAKETSALLPGQQVRVNFAVDGANASPRLTVPASAIVRRGELQAVYVASPNNSFALRAVRLGASAGPAGMEVLSGLRAGEVVATDPLRAAQAGATPAAK